jgi:hypothetical protein
VRSETERRKTLDKPVPTVNSAGIKRVKPSDRFIAEVAALEEIGV